MATLCSTIFVNFIEKTFDYYLKIHKIKLYLLKNKYLNFCWQLYFIVFCLKQSFLSLALTAQFFIVNINTLLKHFL